MFPTIDFDSIEHNIIIIDDVGHFLGVFDRLGILKWENVTKNLPDITILLLRANPANVPIICSVPAGR